MLAVTANWLLSDGSLVPSPVVPAAGWLAGVRRAALRAGCRRDGRYRPVESVCLVFAGDTFELLVSDVWAGRDRPWHGGPRAHAARAAALEAALRSARPVLRLLWRWLRRGMPVPVADGHGRPRFGREHSVPLHVFVLAGDRDGWLGEAPAAALRLGVATGEAWSDGGITVRHGHDLDPLCQNAPVAGRPPSLAESIALELLVPFAMAVRDDPVAWAVTRPLLAGLASASPWQLPVGLAGLAQAWGPGSRVSQRVLAAWQRSVEAWWAAARREPPACELPFDVVDALAGWLGTGSAAAGSGAAPLPAVAAVAGPRPVDHSASTAIIGHGPAARLAAIVGDGPRLAVWRSGGPGWDELLGPARLRSGIVAIGGIEPGQGVVDAA